MPLFFLSEQESYVATCEGRRNFALTSPWILNIDCSLFFVSHVIVSNVFTSHSFRLMKMMITSRPITVSYAYLNSISPFLSKSRTPSTISPRVPFQVFHPTHFGTPAANKPARTGSRSTACAGHQSYQSRVKAATAAPLSAFLLLPTMICHRLHLPVLPLLLSQAQASWPSDKSTRAVGLLRTTTRIKRHLEIRPTSLGSEKTNTFRG